MKRPPHIELAFLPGLDGTGISFEPLSRELPRGIRTTIVTYPHETDHDWNDLVEHVKRQLPPEKPLAVVAESFAGPIAMRMLCAAGRNVRGVIFCVTFAKPPRSLLLRLLNHTPLTLLFRIRLSDRMPDLFFGGREHASTLRPLFRRIREEVQPRVLAHRTKMLSNLDVAEHLGQLNIPCCYIQATDDRLVPAGCIRPFQAALPDLVIKRVEGPHYILQTRPKECARIITDFMRTLTKEIT